MNHSTECCIKLTRFFYTTGERPDSELLHQLQQGEQVIEALIVRPLVSFQFDALVCLASDVVAGLSTSPSGKFPQSFLFTAVNRGMFQVAAAEFHTFCYHDGQLHLKSWNKRRAEQFLFTRGKLVFS